MEVNGSDDGWMNGDYSGSVDCGSDECWLQVVVVVAVVVVVVAVVVLLLKPWLRLFSSDNNAEWVVKSSELTYEHQFVNLRAYDDCVVIRTECYLAKTTSRNIGSCQCMESCLIMTLP